MFFNSRTRLFSEPQSQDDRCVSPIVIALLGAVPLALAMAPLAAQTVPAPSASSTIATAEVASMASARRDAVAARVVISQAELTRFGDHSLADAVQRIPGVSVDRFPGRDAVIRLRGMVCGYTQVLMNGDLVPPGFSIDEIAPSQIERIKVVRTATADMSNQSIAGTINIVLKAGSARQQRQFKLGAGARGQRRSPMASGDYADRRGVFFYGRGASASVDRDRWLARSVTESNDANGALVNAYATDSGEQQRERKLGLTARLSWKPNDSQSLSVNGLLQARRRDYTVPDARTAVVSPTVLWKIPETVSDQLRVALARTLQAPTTRELIARRWAVNQNCATIPNFQGNPALPPELATGLEPCFEPYLTGDAFLGVNVYGRHITNVVLSRVYQSGTTWIATPINGGEADVVGLVLEAKGKLKKTIDTKTGIDLHIGMSRLHSVPGPDNRLSRQLRLTAFTGADWRVAGRPLTVGGNFVFEPGGTTRLT